MRRPVNTPYEITTEFGVPDSNALFKYHSGVDYGVSSGTNVYAPIAGKVVYAQFHNVRGNMVGIFDGTYTHRLMHNSQFKVSVGQQVSEGQVVALSGSTGLSTGPHVHWDIVRGNKMDATAFNDFVDPFQWLNTAPPAPKPAPVQDVLQAYQRRVRSDDSINYRDKPTRSGNIIDTWPVNDVADFKGWVHGEAVENNNVWFVGRYSGGYAWSGGFTDASTNGLQDLNAPAPPPTPAPPVPTYTERPNMGIWGVDVSAFQKSLDFPVLKEQGIEYAILRAGHVGASYGGNSLKTDPTLTTFQKNAREAGVAVGYYWYCFFDEDAQTEAERFVQSIGPISGREPLFADVEEVNGANKAWLETFVTTVEKLAGKRCHIYTYANYLQNHWWINDLLADRNLWLAHYDIQPGAIMTNGIKQPVMHQYTSKGVIRGVGSQYIDLNVYFGTIDQFKQLGDNMPVVTPNVPAPENPKDPIPNDAPPAPLPTPDNNPIRPKVKAGAIAGVIVTGLIALGNLFGYNIDESTQGIALTAVSALVTAIMFLVSYMKRDGLSPKE